MSKSEDFIAGELTCPFCHASWTPENLRFYNLDCGDHCESGRFYSERVDIQIVCHACDRLMYSKDGQDIG